MFLPGIFFLSFFLSVSSFLLEIALVLLVLLFSSASLWFRGGVCLVLFVLVLLLLFLSVFLLLFLSCFHWAWGYVLILSAPHIFRQCFRPLFVPCAHSSRGGVLCSTTCISTTATAPLCFPVDVLFLFFLFSLGLGPCFPLLAPSIFRIWFGRASLSSLLLPSAMGSSYSLCLLCMSLFVVVVFVVAVFLLLFLPGMFFLSFFLSFFQFPLFSWR